MMATAIRVGEVITDKTPDQINEVCIEEFSMTEPITVESMLAEEGQVLDDI